MNQNEALEVLRKFKSQIVFTENDLGIDTRALAKAHGEGVHAEVKEAMTVLADGRGLYSHDGSFVRAVIRGLESDPRKGIDANLLAENGIIEPAKIIDQTLLIEVSREHRNLSFTDRQAIAAWISAGAKGIEGVDGGEGMKTMTGEVAEDIKNARAYAESVLTQIKDSPEKIADAVRIGKEGMEKSLC